MIITILCVIAAAAEASSLHEDKCKSMMQTFSQLCPGKTVYCPEVLKLKNELDEAVVLNWNLMTALAAARKRIQRLEIDIEHSIEAERAERCRRLGGLFYNSYCYTVPYLSMTRLIKLDEAITICNETGAVLGEIHSQAQLRAVQEFIKPMIPSPHEFAYVWLGMKYDHKRSVLTYRNGTTVAVGEFKWDHSYPKGDHPHMILEVGTDGDASIGLWNSNEFYNNDAVLCEIKV